MDRQANYIELVERARHGDRECLNKLAAVARERLRTYVYRLTQQDDLTQEIVQESLLEMCRILNKLRQTDRFWSWLYGIATNKLHRHYRTERTMKRAAASEERRRGPMKKREGGFEDLVGQELKQIVSSAMQKLRTRHKAVLVMRCYDEMSYAEIADSMGCSEFSTRMLFVRAKRALQKELLRNGFHRGSLLAALVVFGKMTAPSKAAAAQLTVPTAALKAGVAASVAGVATSSTGILSLAAATALTVGTVVATSGPGNAVHTEPLPTGTTSQVVSPFATASSAHERYSFYYPEGPAGPVMIRAHAGLRNNGAYVLQNDNANYSYADGAVTLANYRMWLDDLRVFKLPTDSAEMRAFMARVEGIHNEIGRVSAGDQREFMIFVERGGEAAGSKPQKIDHDNILDEDLLQSNWPTGTPVVDNRDAMHRRGWTYFRVRGRVSGQDVTGVGRMPFVYSESRRHSPWLRLNVGDARRIVDGGSSAVVQDGDGVALSKYPSGSFFKGLSRPWMGLHVLDSVRRDAAEKRAFFDARLLPGGRQAEVTAVRGDVTLVYTIDVEADLVSRIEFLVADAPAGSLEFEYLEDVNVSPGEFAAPGRQDGRVPRYDDLGMLWLIRLAEKAFGGQ